MNSKDPFFNDNDWPLESRKKVIRSLPPSVYDCVQKLVNVATNTEMKDPPNFQQSIEQCIFQLPADRKQTNPLLHFKVLNLLAAAYVFDLKSDEAREIFFTRLFLGREANAKAEPVLHDNRIAGLIRFSSLALQYPMPSFLDILAKWLVKEDNYFKCGPSLFAEICKGYLLRPLDWNLTNFVDSLEENSFEFSALAALHFAIKENFAEPHRTPLILIIGKWFAKRPSDYLTFYSQHTHLAKDFALKRFPVLLEYSCTNGIGDDAHNRFNVSIFALIMASKTIMDETPLDLTYLIETYVTNVKDDGNEINQRRVNDCIFVSKKSGFIP